MESTQAKPMKKVRSGRINISIWRGQKRADGTSSLRACVQYSRKNKDTDEWNNQQIWMFSDELHELANALEQLDIRGEDSSSPSSGSVRVHAIMEYIKANGKGEELDVFELQEQGVSQTLADMGIHVRLSPEEQCLVLAELMLLAEKQEFAEMAFQAQYHPYPVWGTLAMAS